MAECAFEGGRSTYCLTSLSLLSLSLFFLSHALSLALSNISPFLSV